MKPNRREFILFPGAAAAAAPGIWIDPGLDGVPGRPWRKVHLDFHNSEHVRSIGADFDAEAFGNTLAAAHVNAIVVFAKDMHGYFYYPSAYGPVHPGLSFDLLGAQVAACRKRGVAVYAYYCTAWDNYLARSHPEWLAVRRDGSTYLPKPGETPGWTALCLAHEEFVNLVAAHTREFTSRYALDGAWFDMPIPRGGECFCPVCLKRLRDRGADPYDTRVQREDKQVLLRTFLKRLRDTVREARPSCQVDFNNQCVYGLGERAPLQDNIDIEALPTASWGYFYYPLMVRYARTFGLAAYGMTGRFKASWADFGGLKLPSQLDLELAAIVANGARCDIGDQMPPKGRLDAAVYHVIGKSYARIQALEPYLDGAVPVTEAALVTSGLPLDSPATPANYGLLKLLIECRVQFDVVEPGQPWERYGLVVLSDDMPVTESLASRLKAFVAGGGRVIASNRAGLLAGSEKTWLEPYGIGYAGVSAFRPAYLIPEVNFTGGIPRYEYALYEGATQWRVAPPAKMIARLGEPAFQRSPEHYTSHAQSPFDHPTDYAVIAAAPGVAVFGFPLGASYYNQGYWVYRNAFRHVLDALLPRRLITANAPLSAEITVMHQSARAGRPERYLVHVVNYSPLRRTPRHPEFYEDPAPLADITVRLNLGVKPSSVRAVAAGVSLPASLEARLRRVPVHEIIAFEVS